MSEWIAFGNTFNTPNGSCRSEKFDGTQVVVFNLSGNFYPLEDIFAHNGEALTIGQPTEGKEITCPRHGARFCIRT